MSNMTAILWSLEDDFLRLPWALECIHFSSTIKMGKHNTKQTACVRGACIQLSSRTPRKRREFWILTALCKRADGKTRAAHQLSNKLYDDSIDLPSMFEKRVYTPGRTRLIDVLSTFMFPLQVGGIGNIVFSIGTCHHQFLCWKRGMKSNEILLHSLKMIVLLS